MQILDRFRHTHHWVFAIFVVCGVIFLANLVHAIAFFVIRRRNKNATVANFKIPLNINKYLNHPARWVFLNICLLTTLQFIPVPEEIRQSIRITLHIILVILIGWFAIGCVYVVQDALMRRYDLTVANNVRARRVHTQTQFLRRILIGFIAIIDFGCILWTFPDPQLWHYGSGLIASAGLASLVLATAAKSTVANLLAGLQIAFTEPIRIDDVVVIQGEWGKIEEITTSYVVVNIWDARRLIVPLSYFIENSFQNWTREKSDLLGTSFLYVDYSIPVQALRDHFTKILTASPLWDGRVNATQVTNLSEHTMEIRCLMSARNSSEQFDLRCIIREEMVKFIQENYPDAFPRTRFASVPSTPAGEPGPLPASLKA
ncbi:mechanosensitive ion channel family protein [Silvibacterium acidisoli]|uniref:mechanosensitive ion channel family protein n=1 Tax=Acidobacteriaceae bacterium ZG23-2 TaxID=2883246 RepID=UPI00406CC473